MSKNRYQMYFFSKLFIMSLCVNLIAGCSFFISGNFVLDSNSELPAWIDHSIHSNKSDYIVEIDVYEPILWMSAKVEIRVKNTKDEIIIRKKGSWEWHEKSLDNINKGNRAPPLWVVVNIDDTAEVYEQSQRSNILKIVKI